MNLFENIYKQCKRMRWKRYSTTETRAIFGEIVKTMLDARKVHRAVTIDFCTMPISYTVISIVDCMYCVHCYLWWTTAHDSNKTRLHRLHVRVKWFLTIFVKKDSDFLFKHQFWCHFHRTTSSQSPQGITLCNYLHIGLN